MLNSNVNTHDMDIVWNNAFHQIFNCCWRESLRPMQYFCKSMPLSVSHVTDKWHLIFMRKLSYHNNHVLRTLASASLPVLYYVLLFCSQYAIKDQQHQAR